MKAGRSYLYQGEQFPSALREKFAIIDQLTLDGALTDIKALRTVVAGASQQAFGDKRLLLIENGDQLSDQLQNTLLKLLEEPPATLVVVVQVARIEALLPTVRSRLHRLETAEKPSAAAAPATVSQIELKGLVEKAKDRKALTGVIETVRDGTRDAMLAAPTEDLIRAHNLLDRSVRRLSQNTNQKLVIDALLLNWPLQSSRSE
jgi:DNA polymerase III delta prime subunit